MRPVPSVEIVPQFNLVETSRLIALSHDGRRVLTAGFPGNAAAFWDGVTGQLLRILAGHEGYITGIGLSEDGTLALTAAQDGKIFFWDCTTGRILRTLELSGEPISDLAVTPDLRLAAVLSSDSLVVLDLNTGRRLHDLTQPLDIPDKADLDALDLLEAMRDQPTNIGLSADGRWLATADMNGSITVHDLRHGRKELLPAADSAVYDLILNRDGSLLFVLHSGGAVLWDVVTRDRIEELVGEEGDFRHVALSRDERHAFLGGTSGELQLRDLKTNEVLRTLSQGYFHITSVGLSGDARRGISTLSDLPPWVWDLTTGQHVANLGSPRPTFTLAAWQTDGRGLIGQPGLSETLLRFHADRPPEFLTRQDAPQIRLLSGDGRRLIGERSGNKVCVLNLEDGSVRELGEHRDDIERWTWDGSRRYLLTGSRDHTAILWDLETGKRVRVLQGGEDDVSNVALSADARFAASNHLGKVHLWDVSAAKRLRLVGEVEHFIDCLALSPNGTLLAAAGDGRVTLWNAKTGQQLAQSQGHRMQIRQLAFSPDGNTLASAGEDGTLRLWNAGNGYPQGTLRGHTAEVTSLQFSPDGRRALTTSGDGTARIWDLLPGRELAALVAFPERTEWVLWAPDGRYDGSPRCERFLAYRSSGEASLLSPTALPHLRTPGLLAQILLQ